jgi:hypothetical protein
MNWLESVDSPIRISPSINSSHLSILSFLRFIAVIGHITCVDKFIKVFTYYVEFNYEAPKTHHSQLMWYQLSQKLAPAMSK